MLAAAGLAVAGAAFAGITLLPAALAGSSVQSSAAVAAAASLLVAAFATLLAARRKGLQRAIVALLATAVIAAVTGLALLALREGEGEEASSVAAGGAMLVGIAAASLLLARAVRLRADLAGDVPRGLLYGEIGDAGFWGRLACLMGMPASTWNRRALATPAFWALLAARPLVYAGVLTIVQGRLAIGVLIVVAGHGAFELGKRLAARRIRRVGVDDGAAPVLFLRSFDDDRFDLGGRSRNPLRRWLALWSFRRNLDEVLVDEVARYGHVVALGRPGETATPFGAARHYATHDDWQRVITETARRAHTIVIVAGDTPGVRWEYALLAREGLTARSVLLFRPGAAARATNLAALAAFPIDPALRAGLTLRDGESPVALLHLDGGPVLLTAPGPGPAAYVLALRAHFQRRAAAALASAAQAAPPISTLPW